MDYIVMLNSFDAFNSESAAQLDRPMKDITNLFSLLYLAEMKLAVFAMVIAIMLLGISFIVKNKVQDISMNKMWAVRIVLIIILIFGMGDAIGIVWNASI